MDARLNQLTNDLKNKKENKHNKIVLTQCFSQ